MNDGLLGWPGATAATNLSMVPIGYATVAPSDAFPPEGWVVAAGQILSLNEASANCGLSPIYPYVTTTGPEYTALIYASGNTALTTTSTTTKYTTDGGVTWTAGGALPQSAHIGAASRFNRCVYNGSKYAILLNSMTGGDVKVAVSSSVAGAWSDVAVANSNISASVVYGIVSVGSWVLIYGMTSGSVRFYYRTQTPETAGWSTTTTPAPVTIYANGSIAIASGFSSSTTYYTSTDFSTWTTRSFPALDPGDTWLTVTVANSIFFLTSTMGAIYKSSDGINWSRLSSPSVKLEGVAYNAGNGCYYGVTSAGMVVKSQDGIRFKTLVGAISVTTTVAYGFVGDSKMVSNGYQYDFAAAKTGYKVPTVTVTTGLTCWIRVK